MVNAIWAESPVLHKDRPLSMPFLGQRSFGREVGRLRTTGLYRYSRNPQLVRGCFFIYVDYLVTTYGAEKVISLVKTDDYEGCLGKSRLAIYDGWVEELGKE
jgi:hypothetical protein